MDLGSKDSKYVIFHNFHILRLSSYAFNLFFASAGMLRSLVIFFKFGLYELFIFTLFSVLFISFAWGKDIAIEGLRGYHNFFVIDGFKFGVILFVFSEFMFFFCIFWTFFDAALVPVHELGV